MPIYEYVCKGCEHRFEKLVKSPTAADRVECPKCGSGKTMRAMSVFAVGSDGGKTSAGAPGGPGMCGRCGGPGPCGMD
jgi:putative FmdB family regulatory protein